MHDLHVWAMSTTENALSAHLVIPGHSNPDQILAELGEGLHEQFEISHTTFQIESGATPLPCLQTACDNQQRSS